MDENKDVLSFSLFAELKPHLSAAQVILRLSRKSTQWKNLVVKLTKSSVAVWGCPVVVTRRQARQGQVPGQQCQIDLDELAFLPTSCHGMKWNATDEELHFRMQASLLQPDDVIKPPSPYRAQDLKLFEAAGFSCSCKLCAEMFVDNKTFKRVLPLPSESWQEMSEFWFCHKHDSDSTEEVTSLAPREGDCLVGMTSFSLSMSMLVDKSVAVEGSTVRCGRCRNVVGQFVVTNSCKNGILKKSIVSLHCHSLQFPHIRPKPTQHRYHDVEQYLLDLLLSQMKKYNCFRVIIEARDTSGIIKPYCLAWILDANTLMYQGEASNSETILLSQCSVVKVLYRDCLRQQNFSLATQWNKDMSVHSIELPRNLCQQLLQILLDSTKSLPSTLRKLNDFYVGYLKRKTDNPT